MKRCSDPECLPPVRGWGQRQPSWEDPEGAALGAFRDALHGHAKKSLARAATDHLGFGKPCSLEGSLAPALLEKGHPASGGGQAASPISQQMLFPGTPSGLFTHDFFFFLQLLNFQLLMRCTPRPSEGQARLCLGCLQKSPVCINLKGTLCSLHLSEC